jgi:purine nucleosidase
MKTLILNILAVVLLIGSDLSAQGKLPYPEESIRPRMRVIIDNDFGGDPDGLFQLVHQILSPSNEIRGIIGSHIKPGGFFDASETSASACDTVYELLKAMNLYGRYSVYEGSNSGLLNF